MSSLGPDRVVAAGPWTGRANEDVMLDLRSSGQTRSAPCCRPFSAAARCAWLRWQPNLDGDPLRAEPGRKLSAVGCHPHRRDRPRWLAAVAPGLTARQEPYNVHRGPTPRTARPGTNSDVRH